jgi:hypothetical protein
MYSLKRTQMLSSSRVLDAVAEVSPSQGDLAHNAPIGSNHGSETIYLPPRKVKKPDEVFAVEERVSSSDRRNPARRLSRARLNVVIGLCVFIVLTFALSVFAAHHTGKSRLACTKGIIFSATVLISMCTILVMILARRTLQEALLAGLLQFVIGFALIVEIRDFMEHVP